VKVPVDDLPPLRSAGLVLRADQHPAVVYLARLALWPDRDLALALRQRAAVDGVNLSVAVEVALRAWLMGCRS